MFTFKDFINETRVLSNIRLTTHQKSVLAIMLNTDDSSAHDEEISSNANMAKAREVLTQLKLIEPTEGDTLVVTDLGREIADEEGITNGGSLTDAGNNMATADATPPPSGKPVNTGPKDDESQVELPMTGVQDAGDIGLPESIQTFKTFISR